MMIIWFVIIGVLIYFLFNGNINFDSFQRKSSIDLLDNRLAKGEINIDEYRELKKIIKEETKWTFLKLH